MKENEKVTNCDIAKFIISVVETLENMAAVASRLSHKASYIAPVKDAIQTAADDCKALIKSNKDEILNL